MWLLETILYLTGVLCWGIILTGIVMWTFGRLEVSFHSEEDRK